MLLQVFLVQLSLIQILFLGLLHSKDIASFQLLKIHYTQSIFSDLPGIGIHLALAFLCNLHKFLYNNIPLFIHSFQMSHDNKDIQNILKLIQDYRLDNTCEIFQCWNFYMRNLHHNICIHFDKSSHSIFTLLDIEEGIAFLAKYSIVFNLN